MYKDLRQWLEQVETLGELRVIRGASWDEEIGAIADLAMHQPGLRPAILFEDIPGYPAGYRVVNLILSSVNRVCLTANIPAQPDTASLVAAWRQESKKWKPLEPRWVEDGPVMENVLEGPDVDLRRFPAPMWHPLDGGRYLGTADLVITRDPDSDWVNMGTYRVMVHDERSMGIFIARGQHGKIHLNKYLEADRPCPIVLSFGHDPLLFLCASLDLPFGLSELALAGGIRGEPFDVIRGPHTGLPIPVTSEIVVEGELLPGETRLEGPFGEWTGYYASAARPEPVVHVKAIYHRNHPIICGACPTKPLAEASFHRSIIRSALLMDYLEAAGVPDVRGAWYHEPGGPILLCAVSIKQRYPGHARQAGLIASQCRVNIYMGKYVIVVDDDIDPTNLEDVLWAMCTRSDPERSILIFGRSLGGALEVSTPPDQKLYNSRCVIDACRPWEWIKDFPPVLEFRQEVIERVKERWGVIFLNQASSASPQAARFKELST